MSRKRIKRIGLLGLGKMGFPLALNLRDHKFEVVAYDPAPAVRKRAAREPGIIAAAGEAELAGRLERPRVIWLMVPAGAPTDAAIGALLPYLSPGDVIIDGGNSNFKDSIRRHAALEKKGLRFLDCGTSGGTNGARRGACTMIGGDPAVYELCRPVFQAVSLPDRKSVV